jgi:hydroxymethylpyrimidine pyrophosphatase-like HAD family hydrolase
MDVKLIALDLDGTALLDDHKTVSPRMAQALREAASRGVLVVPATGRPRTLLPEAILASARCRFAVLSNGALVYDLQRGRVLRENTIPLACALSLIEALKPFDLLVEICADGHIYVERRDMERLDSWQLGPFHIEYLRSAGLAIDSFSQYSERGGKAIEKVNLPFIPSGVREDVERTLSRWRGISSVHSGDNSIEITHALATKGEGLRALCDMMGVDMSCVMAIGDSGNDVSMLEVAGIGVAMGNACALAREAAASVTATNECDGAALAIERYALGARRP